VALAHALQHAGSEDPMAEINPHERVVRAKIVYYGPALGGKTTNLRVLHRRAHESHRGKMISIDSLQDRTILFDLLPVRTVGPGGFELRLQLVAVPGQAFYSATRRAALRGADGVVFVANSAADRIDEDVQSHREMVRHLHAHGLDSRSIPLVMQYNKRDLPSVADCARMDALLNTRGEPAVASVATEGQGVLETFHAILTRTLRDLSGRFRMLAMTGAVTPEDAARKAMLALFGTESSSGEARPPRPWIEGSVHPPEFGVPREFAAGAVAGADEGDDGGRVRIAVTEPPARKMPGVAASARGPVALTEAYTEASTELARALSEAHAQRDHAQRQLSDLRRAVAVAAETPADATGLLVRRMLSCLAEAGGAAHATFAFWEAGYCPEAVTLPPLTVDPVTSRSLGIHYLQPIARSGAPHVEDAADNLELWELLGRSAPPLTAMAVLPVRSSGRLLGLLLLYFVDGDAVPRTDAMEHLTLLTDAFSTRLERAQLAEAGASPEAAEPRSSPSAQGPTHRFAN
jgi:signal recognition particle receptor subunit beta